MSGISNMNGWAKASCSLLAFGTSYGMYYVADLTQDSPAAAALLKTTAASLACLGVYMAVSKSDPNTIEQRTTPSGQSGDLLKFLPRTGTEGDSPTPENR